MYIKSEFLAKLLEAFGHQPETLAVIIDKIKNHQYYQVEDCLFETQNIKSSTCITCDPDLYQNMELILELETALKNCLEVEDYECAAHLKMKLVKIKRLKKSSM